MNDSAMTRMCVGFFLLVVCVTQLGCFEPAPVYASYHPAGAAETDSPSASPLSALFVPELYVIEPREAKPIADTPKDEPSEQARALQPPAEHVEVVSGDERGEDHDQDARVEEPRSEGLIGVINLNTATLEQLQLLPRVGEAMSQRIVEYRARRAFRKPRDARRVKGIGRSTYARFEVHVRVEGETTLRKHKE